MEKLNKEDERKLVEQNNFIEMNKYFNIYERFTGELLKNIFQTDKVKYNDDYKYDIKLLDRIDLSQIKIYPDIDLKNIDFDKLKKYNNNKFRKLTFEVKTDLRFCDTGNFFIETECRGKNSGVTTSMSSYYILSDTCKYYMINTNDLKKIIKNNKTISSKCGTKGKLLKKKDLLNNCVELTYLLEFLKKCEFNSFKFLFEYKHIF